MAQPAKSFQETLRELWDLLRTYAQQETLGPLKVLKRRVSLGLAGSFLFAFGWLMLTLSLMRFLQTHSVGSWTIFLDHDWLVYVAAVLMLLVAMGGAVRKIMRPDADLTTPGSQDDSRPATHPERITP